MGFSCHSTAVTFVTAVLSVFILGDETAAAGPIQHYILNSASGDIPARHASTDVENIDIANHCSEGGGKKEHCLCLVKVLKHDLNTHDYRVIAARIKPEKNAPRLLSKDRYKKNVPAKPLDPILRALLESPDLMARCELADRFYAQAR
ncbi:hypothetical protein GCM10009069_25640 [Algimonas arctica]|uniref:Uncharacterized protein n=1 Tax=Algimonas arctica TaxID=1479486 RepID=A0A8J3G329_9PROT|nr:hypothetical protein [Algimonas arctica]GHB01626.1 hypothetical protein GCM10009069_25640 [Algimonas arctica]